MSFLLDTNVVSEWVKPMPNPNVAAWLAGIDEDRAFLSVVTLAEVRRGIELLQLGRRRDRLTEWLTDELPARFETRIVPIDRRVADEWGITMARSRALGVGLGTMDGFIAATAVVHGLTVVTRNETDFRRIGIALLNPW